MKDILREIGMIARCFDTIANIEFKEYHLERGQYSYLVRICENPGIIQQRVAEMLKVDRTTAARAIKKLVLKGFVEKVKDTDNKKILKLYPTQKSKDIYPLLEREEIYCNKIAFESFTEEEKKTVLKLLRKIRKNTEKDWEIVKKGRKRKF